MAELKSAGGEVFKTDGAKLESAGGKTYRITGFDPESVATKEYVDGKIDEISPGDIPYDNSKSHLEASNLQDAVDEIAALLPGKIETWRQVQDVVRRGLASTYFDIGDSFEVKKGQSSLLFVLIGFDQDVPTTSKTEISPGSSISGVATDYFAFLKNTGAAGEFEFTYTGGKWKDRIGDTANLSQYGITVTGTPAEGDSFRVSIPHTITLKLHDTSSANDITFDAAEATWYLNSTDFPNGLSAGTYHFTAQNVTYQFTLSEAVPAGGVMRYNVENGKVTTYGGVGETQSIESVTVSEGDDGVTLPSIDNTAITANTNGLNQTRYGLNDWAQSSIRQWLNTRAAAGEWWEAQNPFDRPSNTSKAGFLNNVDMDFIKAVGTVYKKTKRNTELGGNIEIMPERFFLLAHSEVYGGTSVGDEGEPYAYFGEGSSDLPRPGTGNDSNRIVKSGDNAKNYWLRTISPSSKTVYTHTVNTTGGITANTAFISRAAVPACVIY